MLLLVQLCRYIYDPADLAAVALGNKDPWEVQPAQWENLTYPATVGRAYETPTGQFRRVTGAAYDSVNQTLYVLFVHSGREIPEDYDKPFHLVHVFQLGSPSTRRTAATQSNSGSLDVSAAAAAGVPDDVLEQVQQQQLQQQQGTTDDAAASAQQQPLRLRRRNL
jgi:hypothetical protein